MAIAAFIAAAAFVAGHTTAAATLSTHLDAGAATRARRGPAALIRALVVVIIFRHGCRGVIVVRLRYRRGRRRSRCRMVRIIGIPVGVRLGPWLVSMTLAWGLALAGRLSFVAARLLLFRRFLPLRVVTRVIVVMRYGFGSHKGSLSGQVVPFKRRAVKQMLQA